ncbi:MAG TPA: LamG-like jellyroll fold domain-containing protein, partial [Nitrososphaeraceae archaeon]|nr:LamG-like jellyroll fold domain-containing protein [Nitrososphaeraceae archaeon]
MWNNLDRHQKAFILAISLTVSSSILILNFQSAFSQNEVSYLDVNSTSTTQLTKFSVAAWFKTSTDYDSNAFIVNKAGASENLNYGIWMTNAEKVRAGFETSSGNAIFATSPLSYSDGKWHYAVVTFDGTTVTLYLDGIPVGTRAASGTPDSGGEEPIRMGANSDALANFFIGNVDEVRVWNTALTAQQVTDAYTGKFDTKGQIEYLDFSAPIVPLNNTSQINGTATNRTGFQDINGTATNQTGFQDINGTVSNETSTLSDLRAKNDTGIVNNTLQNIPPVEIPQTTNDTGIGNDSSTQNQQKAPEENNSPEAFDQSVSVDQDHKVQITLEATDEDNDPLQIDITADPLQGSLTGFDKEKGNVIYVPQNGYSGNDKFSFKAVDDKGSESNIADVDINVKEAVSSNENAENETNDVFESINNTTGIQDKTDVITAEQPNITPKADAGDDRKVEVNTEVKLDGGKSSDEDGKIASYKWEQTDGPEVDIKKADEQTATFDVPESAADSKLVFKLTVVDDKGESGSDDVSLE